MLEDIFSHGAAQILYDVSNKDKVQTENLYNLVSLHLKLRSLSVNSVPREDCSDCERTAVQNVKVQLYPSLH